MKSIYVYIIGCYRKVSASCARSASWYVFSICHKGKMVADLTQLAYPCVLC